MKKVVVQYIYIVMLVVLIILPVAFFTFFGKFFDTTNYENRTLSPKPTLTLATIETYPSDFENYFNDALPFRNQLIRANGRIDYEFFKTSSSISVIIGKDGWLFYKGAQVNDEDPISDYNGSNLYSDEQLAQIATNMVNARDTLAEEGRDFAIFIAPNKERVYAEYMPDAYGEPAQYGRMMQVVDYLKNHTDLTVICPYDQLAAFHRENPDMQIFYKYDTHWNNLGAYIGARELDEALGFTMPEVSQISTEKYSAANFDLATLIHLGRDLTDDNCYTLSNFTGHGYETEKNDSSTEFRFTNTAQDADPRKLFIIGDSFSTMMGQYVACNFNETYLNFYYNYSHEMLEDEDPDLVVYETVERYLNNMLHFSITDGITANPEQ